MKKNDFKKLALLGIAAGSMSGALKAEAAPAVHVNAEQTYLAHSCGAGCGNKAKAGNLIAEEDEVLPITGNSGCNASQRPNQGYQNMPNQGYQNMPNQAYQTTPNQGQQTMPNQGYQTTPTPQNNNYRGSGCGGAPRPNN